MDSVICAESPRADHAKTVVTLNGTENKATVDMAWINRLGLPQNLTSSEGLEFYGKMSILKGAYLYADKLAFPNHIVKNNIEKSVGSDIGMEGVLFSRLGNLETIRLGIDTDKLNPRTDKALDANYDDDDMAGKKTCKNALHRCAQCRIRHRSHQRYPRRCHGAKRQSRRRRTRR